MRARWFAHMRFPSTELKLIKWWLDQAYLDAIGEFADNEDNLLTLFWKQYKHGANCLLEQRLTDKVMSVKDTKTVLPELIELYNSCDSAAKLFWASLSRAARSHMNNFVRIKLETIKAGGFIDKAIEVQFRADCDAEAERMNITSYIDGNHEFKARYRGKLYTFKAEYYEACRDTHLEGTCFSITCVD